MCGINGFNFKDRDLIQKMMEKTRHRGPDDDGFYIDNDISLGHTRLSIIDLSEKGKQPIFNENKNLCVIFNGEIYNFKELRGELEDKGHVFSSGTDTEVILHSYEEWQGKSIDFFNGIFAFAIWDIAKKELFLARDRVGVKPLYYYWDSSPRSGQRFIFSSEIKAILEHNINRKVNQNALNVYFRTMYVPAPMTMFENIYKLPAGSYLILKDGRIDIKKYWDIDKNFQFSRPRRSFGGQAISNFPKKEILERIRFLVKDSVKKQLISDRPLGIFLSGGIDSTSVLGNAAEFLPKIKTFTVGFDVKDYQNRFNQDFLLARQTSKFYNTDHNEILLNSSDVKKNLEKIIWHLDEPIANPTQIATFILSEFARQKVAVALGGDGGDEIFGGYRRYYYSRLQSRYQKIPYFIRLGINFFLAKSGKKALASKLNLPEGLGRYADFMFQKEERIGRILKPEINQTNYTFDFFERNFFVNPLLRDFENQFMITDFKSWLVDESLMRTDKMTMAAGLEQRVPILDHRLVEFAMSIPSKYKLKGKRKTKAIFIEAMKDFLPKHVLDSSYKKGWFMPVSEWLRTDLKGMAFSVLSPNFCPDTCEFFNFDEINKMFFDHIERRAYNLDLIWALITFQIWYKTFISRI